MNFSIQNEIKYYCKKLGSNRLIIQGAGGNISWKENDKLWIKASGMWLIDAFNHNIFVQVDLKKILQEIQSQNYSFEIKSIGSSDLRPSIETILHAILPHKVVLHIHAVEILSHLVFQDYEKKIRSLLNENYICSYIDYKKPGADLAKSASEAIFLSPNVQILFLQNHGIVIGGSDTNEINNILNDLISCLSVNQNIPLVNKELNYLSLPFIEGYKSLNDNELQNLSIHPNYFNHVLNHWPLYPDHIIFLGKKSFCYDSIDDFLLTTHKPDLVFIKKIGVYVSENFSQAQKAQLRCFYDVIVRIDSSHGLNLLDIASINSLTNWDSEKYRVRQSK